jgi:hypothetical protein
MSLYSPSVVYACTSIRIKDTSMVPAKASGAIMSCTIIPNPDKRMKDITEKTMIVIKFLLNRYHEVLRMSGTEKG